MGLTACTAPQCLYKGDLYLLIHLNTDSVFYLMYVDVIHHFNIVAVVVWPRVFDRHV